VATDLPVPPSELVHRVGKIDEPDVDAAYEAIGRHSRERIERLLPADWSWDGKRVLDFGCGAGRTLRHFLDEAERAEFFGCDIDAASIAWLADHFSPPLHVFESGESPSLPQPDGFFDLVYALSVFTHLTDHWAGWLLELHRVLKPDGLLFATFLNEGMWADFGRGRWDEDRIGMHVTSRWKPWDSGGPIVFHSGWWIREHWGRAFDVVFLERHDPVESPDGQGAALLRPRAVQLEVADLERPSNDARELDAARLNIEHLHQEAGELSVQLSWATTSHSALVKNVEDAQTEIERLQTEIAGLQREVTQLQAELGAIAHSRSWRLTAPLRAATAAMRRRSG
jgi:SAM-dependent methyltransferase